MRALAYFLFSLFLLNPSTFETLIQICTDDEPFGETSTYVDESGHKWEVSSTIGFCEWHND